MQQLETTADEIRSIRVDGLAPMMDETYLFNCFCDNAKVVAATVLHNRRTGLPLDYGFVEFASHGDAEFVLDSYHGERMPNFNYERFCLSWDTDGSGTRWRWDYTYESCSFFGYYEDGNEMDAKALITHYMDSIPSVVTTKRAYPQSAYPNTRGVSGEAFPNYTENQLDHSKSKDLSPADYTETDVDKRLKFTDMPLTHPNMYQQGYVGPSLTIQQNQPPDPMQSNGGCGAGYVNDQQLTQVPKGDLERVSSMKNEKELYLCFEEFNFQRGGYVIRTIKLLELLQCSCHFSIETCEITKCKHCAPKIKLESQWRHRAWLHTGEKVRESCGAKETNMPFGMICCSYGSQIIFAGGLVRQPDRETP
uniref:uncharacterized protein LOC101296249 n=1 Tax=Fragaria vesca subsp. vesca TaxID=101020 RepID=UPI0005CA20C6|nr:PREDICTED: uncharacterized protein LOC101296249 [Fragaria vesca subsp. vesca]